jgi:hypothetical protein
MLDTLIAALGALFLVAVALEFVAVFVEQAGAARAPEEEAPRRKSGTLAMMIVSTLTPGLLLVHAFLATRGAQDVQLLAMATPFIAMIGGALLGAVFGALARGAAPTMRTLAAPAGLIALGVTIYAAWPSIQLLLQAAQNGGVVVAP